MKTIKLTLALLAFAICMGSCAMILGIDKGVMMSVQNESERSVIYTWEAGLSPF